MRKRPPIDLVSSRGRGRYRDRYRKADGSATGQAWTAVDRNDPDTDTDPDPERESNSANHGLVRIAASVGPFRSSRVTGWQRPQRPDVTHSIVHNFKFALKGSREPSR